MNGDSGDLSMGSTSQVCYSPDAFKFLPNLNRIKEKKFLPNIFFWRDMLLYIYISFFNPLYPQGHSWQLDYESISISTNELGAGSFGVVYLGKLNEERVAVKKFMKQKMDEKRYFSFLSEIMLLKYVVIKKYENHMKIEMRLLLMRYMGLANTILCITIGMQNTQISFDSMGLRSSLQTYALLLNSLNMEA